LDSFLESVVDFVLRPASEQILKSLYRPDSLLTRKLL